MKTNNLDANGRIVDYLRISVTPFCNLRCNYCYPTKQIVHPGNHELLSIKQITRLVKIYSSIGINKIRVTGGEPLVRKGVARLIQDIKAFNTVKEVSLTTNGVLLNNFIDELKGAGLDRINISLDSLKPEKIKEITGYDVLGEILSSITNVVKHKTWPLKINVVAMRGVNDDEILDFAELAAKYPLELRFIEMMPFSQRKSGDSGTLISYEEIKDIISEKFELVQEMNKGINPGPAKVYLIKGGKGKVGFVSPMSESFCEDCNRIRLTAEGHLRSCLFSETEVDLKPGFAENKDDDWFIEKLHEALCVKPKNSSDATSHNPHNRRPMSTIGG